MSMLYFWTIILDNFWQKQQNFYKKMDFFVFAEKHSIIFAAHDHRCYRRILNKRSFWAYAKVQKIVQTRIHKFWNFESSNLDERIMSSISHITHSPFKFKNKRKERYYTKFEGGLFW